MRGAGVVDHGAEEQRQHGQTDDFKSEHSTSPGLNSLVLFGRITTKYGSISRKDASAFPVKMHQLDRLFRQP
jgi:hypothetical protein